MLLALLPGLQQPDISYRLGVGLRSLSLLLWPGCSPLEWRRCIWEEDSESLEAALVGPAMSTLWDNPIVLIQHCPQKTPCQAPFPSAKRSYPLQVKSRNSRIPRSAPAPPFSETNSGQTGVFTEV